MLLNQLSWPVISFKEWYNNLSGLFPYIFFVVFPVTPSTSLTTFASDYKDGYWIFLSFPCFFLSPRLSTLIFEKKKHFDLWAHEISPQIKVECTYLLLVCHAISSIREEILGDEPKISASQSWMINVGTVRDCIPQHIKFCPTTTWKLFFYYQYGGIDFNIKKTHCPQFSYPICF